MPITDSLKGGKSHNWLKGFLKNNMMDPATQARLMNRMRMTPEVYPLVVIMGGALVGVVSFITYMGISRNDLLINKNRRDTPGYDLGTYDLDHPKTNKLIVLNQKYQVDPQLRQLAEDMKKS